jgi:hemerythrin
MKVECAYCKKTIKSSGDDTEVSHGVCSDCLPNVLSGNDIPIEAYLESIPYPALLVDDDGDPIASNELYRSKIGNDTKVSKNLMDGRTTEKDDSSPTGQRYKGTSTVRMMVKEALRTGADTATTSASAEISGKGRRGRMNMLLGAQRIGKDFIVEIEDVVSMQWYSALSTGRADLDKQHFDLDQILHELSTASFDEGVNLLIKFSRAMKAHFAFEEDLLGKGKLLVGSGHRAEHRKMMKWTVTTLLDARRRGAADFAKVSQQFADHLSKHVAEYDQLHEHHTH